MVSTTGPRHEDRLSPERIQDATLLRNMAVAQSREGGWAASQDRQEGLRAHEHYLCPSLGSRALLRMDRRAIEVDRWAMVLATLHASPGPKHVVETKPRNRSGPHRGWADAATRSGRDRSGQGRRAVGGCL